MDPANLATRSLGAAIPESSTCSHISSEYSECKVQTMCSLCISTGTCEFDVVSLSCETKHAEANGTATSYCSSNDTVCSTCGATAADPICSGEDGACICRTLCSVIEPLDPSDCSSAEESVIAYIGIAVGLVCVASLVFLLVKCRRRHLAARRQRTLETQRQRESELLRLRQPQLALGLVDWRDSVELNRPKLHKLGACGYVMKHEERAGPAGADAGAAVAVDDAEPSTSMESSSTLSENESPATTSSLTANECNYSAMTDDCSAVA
ncbi:hypothetical protein PHYPSEUDO_004536 [Phytophthora pseudosyringae]|uniref:Uncharacterized protein n=1 Tax=Phytophthora pseudosyringae TaxID=221518 RepID=A0A8T1WP87_9STRA|nr:hypothetical protein PHYPSEUDO_004536 [Phytophthora pseudosyringae]